MPKFSPKNKSWQTSVQSNSALGLREQVRSAAPMGMFLQSCQQYHTPKPHMVMFCFFLSSYQGKSIHFSFPFTKSDPDQNSCPFILLHLSDLL